MGHYVMVSFSVNPYQPTIDLNNEWIKQLISTSGVTSRKRAAHWLREDIKLL